MKSRPLAPVAVTPSLLFLAGRSAGRARRNRGQMSRGQNVDLVRPRCSSFLRLIKRGCAFTRSGLCGIITGYEWLLRPIVIPTVSWQKSACNFHNNRIEGAALCSPRTLNG